MPPEAAEIPRWMAHQIDEVREKKQRVKRTDEDLHLVDQSGSLGVDHPGLRAVETERSDNQPQTTQRGNFPDHEGFGQDREDARQIADDARGRSERVRRARLIRAMGIR